MPPSDVKGMVVAEATGSIFNYGFTALSDRDQVLSQLRTGALRRVTSVSVEGRPVLGDVFYACHVLCSLLTRIDCGTHEANSHAT